MNILHDKDKQIFYIETNGEKSVLKYHKVDDTTLDYQSTFVPPSLRGKGIAEEITKYALKYAKENNYKIIPTCSYTKSYIKSHPEYSEIIKK